MITTQTTTAIVCDKCGNPVNAGETWYQVSQSAASGVFDGAAANLKPLHETTLQLCETDYANARQLLGRIAPLISTVAVPKA